MRAFSVLLISMLAISALSDDCNNPLLTTFGFSTDSSMSAKTLTVCKGLSGKNSCCSSETLESISDRVKAATDDLMKAAGTRDVLLKTALRGVTTSFQEAAGSMSNIVNNLAAKLGGEMGPMMSSEFSGALKNASMEFDKAAKNMSSMFDTYQSSRSLCLKRMLRLQAQTWCLACDPSYSMKGVQMDGTITISSGLCTKMMNECYDFIDSAAMQAAIGDYQETMAQQKATVKALQTVSDALAGGNMNNIASLFSGVEGSMNMSFSGARTVPKVVKPMGCMSKDNCNWICNNLFVKGKINKEFLGVGGPNSTSMGNQRILLEEGERALTTNEWNPDDAEVSVTIAVQDDPGNAKSMGASHIVLGLMTFVGAIFMF